MGVHILTKELSNIDFYFFIFSRKEGKHDFFNGLSMSVDNPARGQAGCPKKVLLHSLNYSIAK